MTQTLGSAFAGAFITVIGLFAVELLKGWLGKPKSEAETSGIIVDTAEQVVLLLRTQLQEMSAELKSVKTELIKTQEVVKHLEYKLEEYEKDRDHELDS